MEFMDLEEIRKDSIEADIEGEAKILAILVEAGSMVYRDLRRKSRMRSERLQSCLKSLERQGKIRTADIDNSRGPPTTVITMVPVLDNSPEAMQKRKAAMYRAGV